MLFNEKLDLKLIRLVRDNPILYDHNHLKYMDFNAREVAWQKIGDELKRPAAECKVRWINIRDVNRRILRKCLNNPGRRIRLYKYDSELSFMRPFYRDVPIKYDYEFDDETQKDEEIQMCEDFDHQEVTEDQDPDLAQSSDSEKVEKKVRKSRTKKSKSIKRKKRRVTEEEDEEEDKTETQIFAESASAMPQEFDPADPVDAFLLSIGATLKTFTPYHLNLAKSKIFSIVQEHELQLIVQRQKDEQKISTSHDIEY